MVGGQRLRLEQLVQVGFHQALHNVPAAHQHPTQLALSKHVLHRLERRRRDHVADVDDLQCRYGPRVLVFGTRTFSWWKCARILISRSVRWQKVWCSKGVTFLMATLSPVRLSVAELQSFDVRANARNVFVFRRALQSTHCGDTHQTIPYAPSPMNDSPVYRGPQWKAFPRTTSSYTAGAATACSAMLRGGDMSALFRSKIQPPCAPPC